MSKHLHKKGMLYASLFCAVIGALAPMPLRALRPHNTGIARVEALVQALDAPIAGSDEWDEHLRCEP
jgi:hypothetical protein